MINIFMLRCLLYFCHILGFGWRHFAFGDGSPDYSVREMFEQFGRNNFEEYFNGNDRRWTTIKLEIVGVDSRRVGPRVKVQSLIIDLFQTFDYGVFIHACFLCFLLLLYKWTLCMFLCVVMPSKLQQKIVLGRFINDHYATTKWRCV